MREAIHKQLQSLMEEANVTLAVPMESRVKQWQSIEDKLGRKMAAIEDIRLLTDLVGIRTILLFRTDLEQLDTIIKSNFQVLESEDTSERLGETQFGYQSLHYNIKLPTAWLAVPTMAEFEDLQAEIQVRTIAQHIWAAASHKLQYKDEASVPRPIRRTINRASALLETVDLEFERVLAERHKYKEVNVAQMLPSDVLNVELLKSILDSTFPAQNKDADGENYGELLENLSHLSVSTVSQLRNLLKEHYDTVMRDEFEAFERARDSEYHPGTSDARIEAGVYFTHVGLARSALGVEFGEDNLAEVIHRN